MGRKVDVDDLVDAQEIADRLGFAHRQTVGNLVDRYDDFPAPLGIWGRTRIWDWTEVEAWATRNGRSPEV